MRRGWRRAGVTVRLQFAGGVRTSDVAAGPHASPHTLGCYERRGLLAEPERARSGYRAIVLTRYECCASSGGLNNADSPATNSMSCCAAHRWTRLLSGGKDDGLQPDRRMQLRVDELAGMGNALARLNDTCDRPRTEPD